MKLIIIITLTFFLFISSATALDLSISGDTSPLGFNIVERDGIMLNNTGDEEITWVARTNVDWASVTPQSGNLRSGRSYPFITLSVEQNPTDSDRIVEILFFDEADIDEIDPVTATFIQEGNYNGGNYSPLARIDEITPDTVSSDEALTLKGVASDMDGEVVSYEWQSSLDGIICTTLECQIDSLSLGNHLIRFYAIDNDSSWSATTMSSKGEVFVRSPITNKRPVAVIESISPTKSEAGETVTLSGGGTDPDGDETVTGYEWTSDIDGVICEEKTCSIDNLSVETHTISLRVQDSEGEWSFRVEHDEQIVVDEKVSVFTNNMLSKNIDWRGNQLQITAGSSSWAVVDIFNFHGTKVANVSQHIYPGKNTLSFGEEIPQGYYFLVINVNNSVRNKLVFFTEE